MYLDEYDTSEEEYSMNDFLRMMQKEFIEESISFVKELIEGRGEDEVRQFLDEINDYFA